MSVHRVAIVGGNRIPFARSGGPYAHASNQDMLTAALDGLIARYGLRGTRFGEFAAGAVLKHSRDFNLARETVLGSQLDPRTPAHDVQMACATGLESVISVANKIALGRIDAGIAGGVDSASDAPIQLNDDLRRVLLNANHAKGMAGKLRALTGLRPSQVVPEIPRNVEPRTGMSMGEHAARTALAWGIGRPEQDELAARSHQRLAAAYERGFFDDLLTPFQGLTRDQNLRPGSDVAKLAKLKPVFGQGAEATMTAGNSTPLSDGAATVLLASEEWAKQRRLPVLAYLSDFESAAVDHVSGADGLLMAPVYAVPRLLARTGLGIGDFDLYEMHEAFASQVLCTLRAWQDPEFCRDRIGLSGELGSLDTTRLNTTGSSLAAGHPFAATGGRIVSTLAKLLNERGSGRGLVSVCAAGGQGTVAVLER